MAVFFTIIAGIVLFGILTFETGFDSVSIQVYRRDSIDWNGISVHLLRRLLICWLFYARIYNQFLVHIKSELSRSILFCDLRFLCHSLFRFYE